MNVSYIQTVVDALRSIIVLDPVVQYMRDYTRISDFELRMNCENLSSVMKHMCSDESKKRQLLEIIKDLPENEVSDIEFVETKIGDVIFALKEKYINSTEFVDARKLSDGNLRCMAVITAVLESAPGSLIIMEEVDNGIHPGRVHKLIKNLYEIGKARNIDVLITTHNAMLMNQYRKEQLTGVTVVYREKEKGTSKFIQFIDIDDFSGILAAGGLGDAMTDDRLVAAIKEEKRTISWNGHDMEHGRPSVVISSGKCWYTETPEKTASGLEAGCLETQTGNGVQSSHGRIRYRTPSSSQILRH